jgi:WD40 repeat protein
MGVNVETSQQTFVIAGISSGVSSMAINPSGTLIAAGTGSDTFIVADVENKRVLSVYVSEEDSPASSVVPAFSPDGRYLVTSDSDHGIHIWGVHGSNPPT